MGSCTSALLSSCEMHLAVCGCRFTLQSILDEFET